MTSLGEIEPFKGTDWEECNSFIRSIRASAWKEDKFDDPRWMAGLASTHFSHKALLWHSKLPLDVRHDWFKLEAALLDHWAPPDGHEKPQTQPTPPAVPSPDPSRSADQVPRYVIKIQPEGNMDPCYVGLVQPDRICTLFDRKDGALPIRCNSLPEATVLERTDGSVPSWLVVHWWNATPNLGRGSTEWANIAIAPADTLKPLGIPEAPWQMTAWTVSPSGEVTPVWRNSDKSQRTLTVFVNNENNNVRLVVDPVAYLKDTRSHTQSEMKAKLLLEPVN